MTTHPVYELTTCPDCGAEIASRHETAHHGVWACTHGHTGRIETTPTHTQAPAWINSRGLDKHSKSIVAAYQVRIILRDGKGGAIVDTAERDDVGELIAYVETFARSRGLSTLAVVDADGGDIRKGHEVCTRQLVAIREAGAPVVGTAKIQAWGRTSW